MTEGQTFKGEDHRIRHWKNRLKEYRAPEEFLAVCLGGRSLAVDYYGRIIAKIVRMLCAGNGMIFHGGNLSRSGDPDAHHIHDFKLHPCHGLCAGIIGQVYSLAL